MCVCVCLCVCVCVFVCYQQHAYTNMKLNDLESAYEGLLYILTYTALIAITFLILTLQLSIIDFLIVPLLSI